MQLEDLLVVEIAELPDVALRGHHEVSRRIRKLVQQHDRALAAVHHEPLLVVAFDGRAEQTTLFLVGRLDVLEAPGRPELLHEPLEALVLRLGLRRFSLGAHPKHAQPGNRAQHRGDEQKGGGEEDRLHRGRRLWQKFGPAERTPAGTLRTSLPIRAKREPGWGRA